MQTTQNNNTHNSSNGKLDGTYTSLPLLPGDHNAEGMPASQHSVMPGNPAPHDLLTRLRDKWGNRLGWSFSFSIPTVDDTPLEDTPLMAGLRVIEAQDPGRASTLHHFYNKKLLNARENFLNVLEEENAKLGERNAFAAARNQEITDAQQAREEEREAATLTSREALTTLEDERLAEAHANAAEMVARTGGLYSPSNPSEGCVLRHGRAALEAVAAKLGLPGPHRDAHAHLPTWVNWALTGVIGILMGLSLGIVTHVLEADTLAHHLPLVGVFAVIGFGVATAAKWAVYGSWYRVGQDYYLGCPRSKWIPMLAAASAASLLVLAADVVMERQGLLALMNLQMDTNALTGHAEGPSLLESISSWILPMVVTLPYLICAGGAGYLTGRREETHNRLTAHQEQDWAETDAARRADLLAQAALQAIALVREALRQRDVFSARIAALTAPFDAKIAALEGQRLPEREELDMNRCRRIQDALGDFHGAQITFDVMWEEALTDCGGGGRFWKRLRQAFTGHRTPRRTRREKQQRSEK